jgi:TIR domain
VRHVALVAGDLSQIPKEHEVDFLIVSAFPDDYTPVPGTLIEDLDRNGVSVGELATRKEHDLRSTCGFWISEDIPLRHPHLGAKRILCFEPATIGRPPKVVGEIFRGIFPFLDMERGSSVATSLVAAGRQGWPPQAMFRPLVSSACEWIRRGLPLKEFKIVIRSEALAIRLQADLVTLKQEINVSPIKDVAQVYDIFLSYSSRDTSAANLLVSLLRRANPDLTVFDYQKPIDFGVSYQDEIDQAIERCRRVVALMSPSYFGFPECQEELQIARLRKKRQGGKILFPVYWQW